VFVEKFSVGVKFFDTSGWLRWASGLRGRAGFSTLPWQFVKFLALIHLIGEAVSCARRFIDRSGLSIISPFLVAVPVLEHVMSGATACWQFGSGFGLIGDRCTPSPQG
jgi:hypothetical protein